MTDLDELISKVDAFSKERDWDKFHTPANIAKSISVEAGELLECFLWDEKNIDKESVKDELADVFNGCLQMAIALNIDLKTAVLAKIAKNSEKYPVYKAKGKALKYDEL